MNSQSISDVVIIGAGVQGLSAAYNILLGAKRRMTVIEMHDAPGRGLSGRSAPC